MFTSDQETLINFLNTHLGMVAFLMPWKRTGLATVTAGVTTTTYQLYSLFDMMNIDTWSISDTATDDTLTSKTNAFVGLVVSLLVVLILSFGSSVMYPREVSARLGLDLTSLCLGVVLLALAIAYQGDFDAYWKHEAAVINENDSNKTLDADQMFLVIGILCGQIALSLVCAVDKVRELYNK